jgi:hypothetical protein
MQIPSINEDRMNAFQATPEAISALVHIAETGIVMSKWPSDIPFWCRWRLILLGGVGLCFSSHLRVAYSANSR